MAFAGRRFGWFTLVTIVAMLASLWRARRGRTRGAAPLRTAKLDPWVLSHAVAGQPAEFIVVMAEQADLSHAERLRTKLEKGRFVRDALVRQSAGGPRPRSSAGCERAASNTSRSTS
jgi:hypothetical protein